MSRPDLKPNKDQHQSGTIKGSDMQCLYCSVLEQISSPGSFHDSVVSFCDIRSFQQPQGIFPCAQHAQSLMGYSIQRQSLQINAKN